jgi:hypothetical protein
MTRQGGKSARETRQDTLGTLWSETGRGSRGSLWATRHDDADTRGTPAPDHPDRRPDTTWRCNDSPTGVNATARATGHGHSLRSFQVYGSGLQFAPRTSSRHGIANEKLSGQVVLDRDPTTPTNEVADA